MAVVIPPSFAQASVEHWLAGYTRPAVTVWGVKILGVPDDDPVGMANAFQNLYRDTLGSQIDANVTIRSTRIVIGQDGGDPLVGVATDFGNGGATRESVAPALSLMVSKNTGLGGRKNRGRAYFPWAISDTGVAENGAIATTNLSAWQSNLTDFLEAVDTADLFEGLYVLHSDPSVPPTKITSMVPNPVVRTQKQRQARF